MKRLRTCNLGLIGAVAVIFSVLAIGIVCSDFITSIYYAHSKHYLTPAVSGSGRPVCPAFAAFVKWTVVTAGILLLGG